MTTFLENQNWRYATKKFDATKKISEQDINILKEAIRLSTSSYGLQPYKILIIENPEIREKLKTQSWNQSQIVDASHVFVFANYADMKDIDIDAFVENTAATRNINLSDLKSYGDFMKSKITSLPKDTKLNWAAKQTYLALANLLNAAAELKIDVTPMEGFEVEKYNELLGLSALGLTAALVAPAGYRHQEDTTQHLKKVRKSTEDLFITIK